MSIDTYPKMLCKSLSVLALLVATAATAAAEYHVKYWNKAGVQRGLWVSKGYRLCFCLRTTQTSKIKNEDCGDVKLFSTSDCEGNFVQLGRGKTQSNTEWVNSVSFGDSGKASKMYKPNCPSLD
ncbi:hypothetical protein EC968_005979 [Mortierella alpina]|nr:hypothetical protein EC968_005979 [Mortierella alpina]